MRSDMPHAEVAEAILAMGDVDSFWAINVRRHLEAKERNKVSRGYALEQGCRLLVGCASSYCTTHYPNATVEDILTVATLIERKRSA